MILAAAGALPWRPTPWRPADGLEAAAFARGWCRRCGRSGMAGRSCPLMGLAAAHRPGDPPYPKAFVLGCDGRPSCTEFVEIGRPEAAGTKVDTEAWGIPP